MTSPAMRFTAKRPPSSSGMTRSTTARTRPSMAPRRAAFAAALGALAFMPEVEDCQRRKSDANRMIAPVRRNRMGLHAAVVADTAAAVNGCVRVQCFAPEAGLRHAEQIILARHRREVTGDEQLPSAVARLAHERECRQIGVAAVEPLETLGLEID